MVLVIIGLAILSSLLFIILRGPMQAYEDVERRARLVAVAQTALSRMTRELRLGLPNSTRINSGNDCDTDVDGVCAVEMLRTLEGARYRVEGDGTDNDVCASPDDDTLSLVAARDCFQVLGNLNSAAAIAAGGTAQGECLAGSVDCLVVYNLGQSGGNDAYAGQNIAAISAVTPTAITFDNSGDQPGFFFPLGSPRQRFFVVDTAVSFVCAPSNVHRHDSYPITPTQLLSPGGTTHLLVDHVSRCVFRFQPGTATRGALVSLRITLTDADLAESVTLLQQVHLSNAP
jgi:MSHA biogenesis protein MshO